MKFLATAILLTTLLSQAKADVISFVTSGLASTAAGVICLSVSAERAGEYCEQRMFPGLLSTSFFAIILKEEAQAVTPDAYDFLAGEAKTEALDEIIQRARSLDELQNSTDEEIAQLIIASTEI
jgi:hypothetical protein